MKLKNILKDVKLKDISNKSKFNELLEKEIIDLVYDSRKAKDDTIFFALKGATVDGHNFIESAFNKGTKIFVIEESFDKIKNTFDNKSLLENALFLQVEDSRYALSQMSKNFFENPSNELKIIGVTGTKGKTTITNYIAQVLNKSGIDTGIIGTNGIIFNDNIIETSNTTPESYELQKYLRKMLDEGIKCVAMEVSSSGLMMKRVEHINFYIGLFTNLSLDHVGDKEHPTFEHYKKSKAHLFSLCQIGIFNLDDEASQYMISEAKSNNIKIINFSLEDEKADYYAYDLSFSKAINNLETNFKLKDNLLKENYDYLIPSPGKFSVYNALSLISISRELGLSHETILEAIKEVFAPGRVQLISGLDDITVMIDYAHNKLSMENILKTLKEYDPNKIIVVFGSVGSRSQVRRKELAEAVSAYADAAVLTSEDDNFEPTENILNEIEEHMDISKCQVTKICDRKYAIEYGINLAKKGDIVLIAGKGNEKYMKVKGKKIFYDEKQTVIDAIKKRKRLQ